MRSTRYRGCLIGRASEEELTRARETERADAAARLAEESAPPAPRDALEGTRRDVLCRSGPCAGEGTPALHKSNGTDGEL